MTAEQSLPEAEEKIANLLGPFAQGDRGELRATYPAELVTGRNMVSVEEEGYRRRVIFAGVRYLLATLASQRPIVVVVDGLQWADRPGLELLTRLLQRKDKLPILAIFITRSDDNR